MRLASDMISSSNHPLHAPICSTSLSSAGPVISGSASFFCFTSFTLFFFFLKIGLCFVVFWLASFLSLLGDSRCSHKLPPSSGAVLRPATDSARGTPLSANGRRPKRSSHLLSGFVPPAKTIAGPWCGLRLKRARGTPWCHCTDEFYVSNREKSL